MGLEATSIAIMSDGSTPTRDPIDKYSIYDNRDFICDFCAEFDGKRRVSFICDDLTSMEIIRKIENTVSALEKDVNIHCNLSLGKIDITYSPKKLKLSKVIKRIESLGVTLIPDVSQRKSSRHDLMRIGFAGFAFLNIMLFSSADYLSGDEPMNPNFMRYFHFTQLVLCTPVVFYCCSSLIRRSFYHAKRSSIIIDQPIMIAIFATFVFSTFNVLTKTNLIYFDSVAAVTFLMLSARFLQKKYLEKSLVKAKSFEDSSDRFVLTKDKNEYKRISNLKIGEHFVTNRGQGIAVDSVLLSDNAKITYEKITGESKIYKLKKGDIINSGATLESREAHLEALENGITSFITKLRNHTNILLSERPPTILWTDRFSGFFFALVIILAGVCFLFYLPNMEEAFSNAIAMLLVACPCSFAIAIPLSYSKTINIGLREKIAFKALESIQKLNEIETVVFDKTGTLTVGRPTVNSLKIYNQNYSKEDLCTILRTVHKKANHHSVYSAIEYLGSLQGAIRHDITNIKVIHGKGVKAILNEKVLKIGSAKFVESLEDTQSNFFISIDNAIVASFEIIDKIHDQSLKAIEYLKDKGMEVKILSGDKKSKCIAIGRELSLKDNSVYFEHTPNEKKSVLAKLANAKPTAMVGDGINDALALGGSHLGISVSNGTNFLKEKSDICLLEPGIEGVAKAVRLTAQTQKSLYASLGFALLYNTTGILLAFNGVISPVVAAVTMPINSLIVSYLAVVFIKGGAK